MRSGKRLIILTLLGVNLALLVGLVAVNMQPAQARPFKSTDYVMVTGKVGQTTGAFDTEIVSMSLSGDVLIPGSPVPLTLTIQESPSQASIGVSGQVGVDSRKRAGATMHSSVSGT